MTNSLIKSQHNKPQGTSQILLFSTDIVDKELVKEVDKQVKRLAKLQKQNLDLAITKTLNNIPLTTFIFLVKKYELNKTMTGDGKSTICYCACLWIKESNYNSFIHLSSENIEIIEPQTDN